jgi:hypothetical protein
MASKGGRVINSWDFPEGRLMKAVAVRLYDMGLRGKTLEQKFSRLIPRWKSYFSKPISDGALSQRADKARRYINEAPENNLAVFSYWAIAAHIVTSGRPVGKRELQRIIRTIEAADPDIVTFDYWRANAKPKVMLIKAKRAA